MLHSGYSLALYRETCARTNYESICIEFHSFSRASQLPHMARNYETFDISLLKRDQKAIEGFSKLY